MRFLIPTAVLLSAIGAASAQEPFYSGKTIRIIVGSGVGGRSDGVVARRMGRHIPGNPTIIVQEINARYLAVANYLYNEAKPDGLTIGHLIGNLVLSQILERPGVEFDARKLEYIGTAARDNPVCAFIKASGITSIEKWMGSKAPVKLAGTYPGSVPYDAPKVLKAALGLPLDLVSGFIGTSDIRLAIENGEIAGGCWRWESIKVAWPKEIKSGDGVVVLQVLPKPHGELPGVPLAIDFAKTEEARQLIRAGIHDPTSMNRVYALPPGTPKERVEILRKAFTNTMKDPDFLADAKNSRVDVEPVSAEEIEKTVARLFRLNPVLVNKLRDILTGE